MTEWRVEIEPKLVSELAEDFLLGPIVTDDGRRFLTEQTVARVDGLKIEIFSNEHPPPHFRVSYQGETNNFDICTGEPLEGAALSVWFRNIRKWHKENRHKLVARWNDSRPTDCTVGPVQC